MENHSDKMKIFLNASIQEITILAEILAAEVIREKPKDPYKHLAMCLQTMIDIRETTSDFREHMKNIATKKQLQEVGVTGGVPSLVCIRDELMICTTRGQVLRYRWDGSLNRDYCLDLGRVPFCIDQQVSKAEPITEANVYVAHIEYSPLVGGFAAVLNDGRAAFLTAFSLQFDPNQVQGIWAQGLEDATCAALNHKHRLIAFGRGLEVSHQVVLSSKDFPGAPGAVSCLRWSPDGCALALAWSGGGISLWSTFGSLLMCSLAWDHGLKVPMSRLKVDSMDWAAEGYQLWMVERGTDTPMAEQHSEDRVLQMEMVKSPLTEIEREDHDELDKKSKKHLMESAMSTTFTRNSVGLEEKVPSWFENLMSRRSSVPLSRQVSTIASDLKKGPSAWIDANSTLNILPSYTKHSPNENQTYKSRKHSCELPVSPRQYLKTKYDITPSNRTPKSPYSPNNSDDMLHLTRSKIPSSKNLSANKAAVTRNSSATRQQRKCPVNLSTDSRDLASCMTIKSLSNTLQPKKCHSVPVNSTQGSLTPPPDRSHSHSLPCIATSQWSIPATPPSSPGKSH
ncbi:hypothetical protein B566_EDAN002311 [Ephemera danica]|nr:hypothetical protein B566_EDAN002311 [Ephemera danica]